MQLRKGNARHFEGLQKNSVDEVDKVSLLWNYRQLGCAFLIALFMQSLLLPGLCYIGTVNMQMAFIGDLLIFFRCVYAYITRERGKGWIFYCILLYMSAPLILICSMIIFDR